MRLVGLDEREIERWVRKLAARTRTAIDIGANDGWYSIFFASLPNVARVYAFDPELTDEFDRNVAANGSALQEKVVRIQRLVGDGGDGTFAIDRDLGAVEDPVVVKIDVEGAEVEVLRGAVQLLKGDVSLIVEVHSRSLERECLAFLGALGYETVVVSRAWYRFVFPERRNDENRWVIATKPADGTGAART